MHAHPEQPSATRPQSRRALLAGALGGIGALALSAVGRAPKARAADGEAVLVGGEYVSTSVTSIANNSNSATVIRADSNTGVGLWGFSASANGVVGQSSTNAGIQGTSESSIGLYGLSTSGDGVRGLTLAEFSPAVRGINKGGSAGVFGYSGLENFPTVAGNTGVHGLSTGDSARGVIGETDTGQGVRGLATSGVGVFAAADSGYALRGEGRIRFDRVSGVAVIGEGATTKTVDPGVNVTADSFVLLTPKVNIGSRALWYTTNAGDNTFTIHLSSARGSRTRVAWLLVG